MSAGFNRRQALARFGSLLAASPLLRAQQAPKLIGEAPGRIAPPDELVNVLEFAPMAERKLDNPTYATIAGGDSQPFERITFRQRLMVNTVDLDLSTELFGTTLFAPIIVGPSSHQKRFHPEGELAMARGATAGKGLMVVAGRSSFPLEQIAAQLQGPFWYQLLPGPDAAAVVTQAQQAVQAGCKAILITVGTPYEVNRTSAAGSLSQLPVLGNPAIDWDYLDTLRQKITVPILLKGIMSADEAHTAVEKGIAGIVVSNHGGRFLTGLAHPITVLPAIADAVGQKIPILIDGSFRRGSDVIKALALGARAVLIARPPLWGLAAYGADGVQTVLELLQTELAADMAMIGAPTPQALVRDMVKIHRRKSQPHRQQATANPGRARQKVSRSRLYGVPKPRTGRHACSPGRKPRDWSLAFPMCCSSWILVPDARGVAFRRLPPDEVGLRPGLGRSFTAGWQGAQTV